MELASLQRDAIASWLCSIAASVPFLGTLLILMLCDVIIGIILAITQKTLSSSVSFKGIGKKAVTLVIIGVCATLGREANMPLAQLAAGAYCVTELLSIVENSAALGVPFPQAVIDTLPKVFSKSQGTVKPGT